MNGISFMQVLQTQPTTQVSLKEASRSANDKLSFFQMLSDSLGGKSQETSALLKEGENKELLAALYDAEGLDINSLKEKELEELKNVQKLISHLVDELSENNAFLADEVLTNPLIEDLLEQLSYQLQHELEALFEGNSSLKSFIEQDEGYLDNPVQLLAFVIGSAHIQSQNQAQAYSNSELDGKMSLQTAEKLQIQLEKLLAILSKNDQHTLRFERTKAVDLEGIVKLLTTSLQSISTKEEQKIIQNFKVQNQSGKEAQFILSAFSRITSELSAKGNQGIVLPSSQGLLNSVQQFVIHVGESRGNQPNNEQFLRQFQNLLGRSSLAQFPNGVTQLSIKLYPEHLGRLDVKLTQQNGVIVAQLMTTTNAAKSAIESQLNQLRQAFVAQNIQVDKIEITTQQQHQSLNQSDKESHEGKNQNQPNQEQQQQDQNDVEEAVSFEDFFEESFNTKA